RAPDQPVVRSVVARKSIRWVDGELEVFDDPLSDVVAELARYTDHRIVASDPRLSQVHVGGVLSVRDVESALHTLQESSPLQVARNPTTREYTLSYRDAGASHGDINEVRGQHD